MSIDNNFEHINLERNEKGHYAIISINRPDKLNALQIQTLKEIAQALESIEVDPKIRCVVLRGTREYTKKPAFSAGGQGPGSDACPATGERDGGVSDQGAAEERPGDHRVLPRAIE